jgi:protoporphyrinogen oxidase
MSTIYEQLESLFKKLLIDVEISEITILGGGPAGLSAAYYAKKAGFPFHLYEANHRVGGNCVTFQHGEFLFDSGAHRFHDKDPDVTEEVRFLLGDNLRRNKAPSKIFFGGKLFDFPLSPLNLLGTLGPLTFTRAGVELLLSRLKPLNIDPSFEEFAVRTYGGTIAYRFLLNYSEKLWGTQASHLSPVIAGTRMKGLNLKTFITEAFKGKDAKIKHLDGSFLYPKLGIGMITDSLAKFCGENIQTNSRITKLLHNQKRIEAVEINQDQIVPVERVVSTLPLGLVIRLLDPAPAEEIQQLARGLRFRNLILVALFLDRDYVGDTATLYFPEPHIPFSRVYEPKVRSEEMSPAGKTSLVAEVPCSPQDEIWKSSDSELVQKVSTPLCNLLGVADTKIIDSTVVRIPNAYPVLEKGFEQKVEKILNFLGGFENLTIAGRNAMFNYTSIHDMIRSGKQLIEALPYASSQAEIIRLP